MDAMRVMARGAILAVIFAAAVFAGSGERPGSFSTCGRVGTWFGLGDSGFSWIATDTPGPNATVGQLALEWTVIDPTLGGWFQNAVRTTNAVGVWAKVNRRLYELTWVAYGLDANGLPVYVARASGTAELADCDNVDIIYVLEIFDPTQDISVDPPAFGCVSGTATETRMPLVQATCEE